jgi:hypothetical protein
VEDKASSSAAADSSSQPMDQAAGPICHHSPHRLCPILESNSGRIAFPPKTEGHCVRVCNSCF